MFVFELPCETSIDIIKIGKKKTFLSESEVGETNDEERDHSENTFFSFFSLSLSIDWIQI